ncbi:MAG: TIGR03862 family flavoprotein [Pseudobdellovibrionaceae bacterium]
MPPAIIIIGTGPAGLMAADILSRAGKKVHIYDHKPSVARKFLMAGRGGLNITHSEEFELLITRYGDSSSFLRPALEHFPPATLRAWCTELGEETFIGSSGRVFPKSFKASPLLRAWLNRLNAQNVTFHMNHRWNGWNAQGDLHFESPNGSQFIKAEKTILALGGASWPKLGSTASWKPLLEKEGITVVPFRPTNCGFFCAWSDIFANKYAGTPLKSITLTHQGHRQQGDAMVTQHGIEGGLIYAFSSKLRDDIDHHGQAFVTLDLKPDLEPKRLEEVLNRPRGRDSFSNFLRKTTGLPSVSIGLLMEDRKIQEIAAHDLAHRIKNYSLTLTAPFSLERAISSAGGIALDEIAPSYMLKKKPHVYAIGEMLDWEAPTGGYLLQACFSMAAYCAHELGA